LISRRSTAGRTIALVRRDDASRIAGPGLQESPATFDELVLGYLDGDGQQLSEEILA
jgi:hypothetical protein